MDILKLDINNFRKEYIKISDGERKMIILNPDFQNIDSDILLFVFNFSNDELKNIIINNNELVLKLLKHIMNKSSKINIINEKYQEIIISKPEIFLNLSDDELFNIIKSMKVNIYKKFIDNLNNYIYSNEINSNILKINQIKSFYQNKDIDMVKDYLNKKYNINIEKLTNSVALNFYNKNRNIFELYRIETFQQLYVYNRFDIVVSKEIFEDKMDEKYNISMDLLNAINSKHVIKIINELRNKGNTSDTELFITAIKLYCLFGLDNSLKIINDKFTYTTPSSLKRAAELEFTTKERQYRLTHPDEYLNYELLEKLRKSLLANKTTVLKKILVNHDDNYVMHVYNMLKSNFTLDKSNSNIITDLNQIISLEINNRENDKKTSFFEKYYKNNNNKRGNITSNELFELFKEFDPFYTIFDNNRNVVMNEDLKKFLLGNEKSDNDCLLRMVFNKQALDYDTELINIINNYSKILETKKNIKLDGNYSLLDTLDIYKIIRYKLEPDEIDIPLSIISKIFLSKKHLNVSEEESINNFKLIYKEQKKKYASTIPRVKGVTKNNYQYKVLDKNDPEILTCGVDTGNCFKPGGPGWQFYKYCLTSEYGDVIGITAPNGKLYICPVIRNGNGLYGNGIDPEGLEGEELTYVLEALKKCYSEIIRRSSEYDKKFGTNEKIDFCTLTDLHEYINDEDNYKIINITKPPMIGDSFYCDIIKNNITNYVLVGDASKIKEYIPKITYLIPRNKPYIYSPDQKENKLKIEQKINEIQYCSIDSLYIDEEKKQQRKEKFQKIEIDLFSYVICNDDWYIAISDQYGLKSAILQYDPRAQKEFYIELSKINNNNKVSMDINKTFKRM